jgi:hypothetical protein
MKSFPNNKSFAFSIFDDTDLSTVDNIAPVYRLLTELGMRITKSVWPLATVAEGKHGGCSLQEPEYLSFILQLQDLGFEIAMHNMRNHHCSRELVEQGFAEFRRLIGHYPRAHANHSRNNENLYWGAARFKFLKSLYALGARVSGERSFEGHFPESGSFWGDLCHEHVDYVRNLVFRGINLDRINPTMPYHDPAKPLVRYWFSSCDGSDVDSFCNLLSSANQERLERERGVCIVYTHFACGFATHGAVDFRIERALRALAQRNGWFVPVSELLDHLRLQRRSDCIPALELAAMESRWACDRTVTALARLLRNRKQPESNPLLFDHAPAQTS